MKIPALVTVVALTCGTAFAAQYDSGSADRDAAAANRTHSAAVSSDTQSDGAKGGGLIDKTKRAFHRLGEKMRNATHRTANAGRKSTDRDAINEQAARNDARSMGAAGSDTHDSDRKHRMDDAYANWQSKQKK